MDKKTGQILSLMAKHIGKLASSIQEIESKINDLDVKHFETRTRTDISVKDLAVLKRKFDKLKLKLKKKGKKK